MGNYLTERRKELGLTMKQVAEAVGVSEATVSRWESGAIANMRRDRIRDLAKVLKTRPTFIMTGELGDPFFPNNQATPLKDDESYIPQDSLSELYPVLKTVSFGKNNFTPDNYHTYIATSKADSYLPEDYFWFEANDNGMAGIGIVEGSLLLLYPSDNNWASSGEIVLAVIKGSNKVVVRKIEKKNNAIILLPKNDLFEPLVFIGRDTKNLQIIGVVQMAKIYFDND